jgi:hypothetical protein
LPYALDNRRGIVRGCPAIAPVAYGLDGCPDRNEPWEKSRKERKKEPKKERKEVCYISIYLYISLIIDIHIE